MKKTFIIFGILTLIHPVFAAQAPIEQIPAATSPGQLRAGVNNQLSHAETSRQDHEARVSGLEASLSSKEDRENKGAANGYAGLDDEGKVPASQLPASSGTDDQIFTNFSLNGTVLSITLENGNTVTVDLTPLQGSAGTDDQTITDLSLSGNTLSITLENGNTATVDLSAISGSESDPVFNAWDKNYADLTNRPTLGTAAAYNVGTGPGQLPPLGGACTVGDGAYTDEPTCTSNGGEWVGSLPIICDPESEDCNTKLDVLSAYEIDQRIANAGGGGTVTISTSQPSGGSAGDVWYVVGE